MWDHDVSTIEAVEHKALEFAGAGRDVLLLLFIYFLFFYFFIEKYMRMDTQIDIHVNHPQYYYHISHTYSTHNKHSTYNYSLHSLQRAG